MRDRGKEEGSVCVWGGGRYLLLKDKGLHLDREEIY